MRSMWTFLSRAAALLVVLTWAIGPSPAEAGTYVQYSCRHPDGTVAPSDGWELYQEGGGSTTPCTNFPYDMIAQLPGVVNLKDTSANLSWAPHGDAVLRSFTLWREVRVSTSVGTGTTVYRLNSPTLAYQDPDVREQCHSRFGCSGIPDGDVTVGGLALADPIRTQVPAFIIVTVRCHDDTCVDSSQSHGTYVRVHAATLTLGDDAPPTFSGVGGTLASAQPVWGLANLAYSAADIGGGIYRQKLVVDGKPVVEEVADPNGGKCYDAMPGWGSPYEFDYTLPCAAKLDGRISFDLNRISVGPHEISAAIEDAAGNARTIYTGHIDVLSDPARRVFDNQGMVGLANPMGDRPGLVANGGGASRDALLVAYVRRLRHGRQVGAPTRATSTYPSSPTLVARLTAGGRPIVHAIVSVLERESGSTTWRATRSLTTSRLGGVSLRLEAGPSREVRFAYVPDSESASFIASRSLTVNVRPRVTLSASPKRLRTGQRVRFSGRVTGGPIPSPGLALSLQASGLNGRWLTFKTIRTSPAGRFHAAYRFTATTGTVRYRFRIRVLRQGGYPFAAAYSRSVAVRVRG
jgi:hypothetical protein